MPSLLGPTGVVSTPDALVAPMGQIQTVVDYARLEGRALDIYDSTITRTGEANLWGFEALAAVANGAELWAAYSKDNSDFDQKTWGVGAKYQIQGGCGPSNVLFAVGGSYRKATGGFPTFFTGSDDPLFLESDKIDGDIKGWDLYAVATADLTAMGQSTWCGGGRLLGSVGVIYKKITIDGTDHFADFEDEVLTDSGSNGFHAAGHKSHASLRQRGVSGPGSYLAGPGVPLEGQ